MKTVSNLCSDEIKRFLHQKLNILFLFWNLNINQRKSRTSHLFRCLSRNYLYFCHLNRAWVVKNSENKKIGFTCICPNLLTIQTAVKLRFCHICVNNSTFCSKIFLLKIRWSCIWVKKIYLLVIVVHSSHFHLIMNSYSSHLFLVQLKLNCLVECTKCLTRYVVAIQNPIHFCPLKNIRVQKWRKAKRKKIVKIKQKPIIKCLLTIFQIVCCVDKWKAKKTEVIHFF